MANQKKAKKTLAKKAMKKTKGGAAYIKFDGVDGEVSRAGDDLPIESISMNYGKL